VGAAETHASTPNANDKTSASRVASTVVIQKTVIPREAGDSFGGLLAGGDFGFGDGRRFDKVSSAWAAGLGKLCF
jgi:hypothetical protein